MSLVPLGVTSWCREATRRIVRDCASEGHPIVRVWGYAPWPDHWNRRCVDLMTYDADRNAWVGAYLVRHHAALNINWLICNGRAWRSYPKYGAPAYSWGPYAGRNPHRDHVHLETRR